MTEDIMDNFMEKLTHKFSATDLIKANSQADAAELESKKEQLMRFESQMEKVDNALSDIRELNLRNVESAQEVQNLAKASSEKITQTVGTLESESVSRIKETSDLSIAGINKTVDESIAKIEQIRGAAENTEALNESLNALSDKLVKMRGEMEEYLHTDHVKIYRNVQVSMNEEFEKRTAEIIAATKKKGAIVPLEVIILLLVAADLAINVLKLLGIL